MSKSMPTCVAPAPSSGHSAEHGKAHAHINPPITVQQPAPDSWWCLCAEHVKLVNSFHRAAEYIKLVNSIHSRNKRLRRRFLKLLGDLHDQRAQVSELKNIVNALSDRM